MIDRKHKGARSELIACAWLVAEGYAVFRNVSQHGTIDIVALKGAEILRIDVKSMGKRRAKPPLEISQEREGIKALYVDDDGHCHLNLEDMQVKHLRCENCGKLFRRRAAAQRHCSLKCDGEVAARTSRGTDSHPPR